MKLIVILVLTMGMLSSSAQEKKKTSSKFPVVALNGKTSGNITRSELLDSTELKVVYINGDQVIEDTLFEIATFKMSIFGKGKSPVLDKEGIGSHLTKEIRDLLLKTHTGDRVFFEYIRARTSDNYLRNMPALNFVVVGD